MSDQKLVSDSVRVSMGEYKNVQRRSQNLPSPSTFDSALPGEISLLYATSIALIGAGGIGETSIALTVLHHDHMKEQLGDSRRFIRCDEFTPLLANFLA